MGVRSPGAGRPGGDHWTPRSLIASVGLSVPTALTPFYLKVLTGCRISTRLEHSGLFRPRDFNRRLSHSNHSALTPNASTIAVPPSAPLHRECTQWIHSYSRHRTNTASNDKLCKKNDKAFATHNAAPKWHGHGLQQVVLQPAAHDRATRSINIFLSSAAAQRSRRQPSQHWSTACTIWIQWYGPLHSMCARQSDDPERATAVWNAAFGTVITCVAADARRDNLSCDATSATCASCTWRAYATTAARH